MLDDPQVRPLWSAVRLCIARQKALLQWPGTLRRCLPKPVLSFNEESRSCQSIPKLINILFILPLFHRSGQPLSGNIRGRWAPTGTCSLDMVRRRFCELNCRLSNALYPSECSRGCPHCPSFALQYHVAFLQHLWRSYCYVCARTYLFNLLSLQGLRRASVALLFVATPPWLFGLVCGSMVMNNHLQIPRPLQKAVHSTSIILK